MKNFFIMFVLCLGLISAMSFANQYYKNKLPYVTHVEELKNDKIIEAGEQQFHIHFSEPMDRKFSGFNVGPSKEAETCFVIETGFVSEKVSAIKVNLESGKHYQLEVSTSFRNEAGKRIKPYLIDFKTKK